MDAGSLFVIVLLPVAAGILLACTGRRLSARVWQGVALAATTATFACSLLLWSRYDLVNGGLQLFEHRVWIGAAGLDLLVGIDGISLVLVLLTTFLVPIALLATWTEVRRGGRGYVLALLALESGLLGAFVSLNLFAFYVCLELVLVPTWFLIGSCGGPRRAIAALKLFLLGSLGSVSLLIALLVVYRLNFEQSGGLPTLDWVLAPGTAAAGRVALSDTVVPLAGADAWWRTQPFVFALLAFGFGIKASLFPLHGWLPDAQVEAPTAGAIVLSGALVKLGGYGLLRFGLPLVPDAAFAYAPALLGLAVVGILYGALLALAQSDLRRLIAYLSVAQLGAVLVGLFALNPQGLVGAVVSMVSHGLCVAALLALVGFLVQRRQTAALVELGGIARPMPVFASLFVAVGLACAGTPMLSGFVGELLILLGAFQSAPWLATAAAVGAVIVAAAMAWAVGRALLGPVDNPDNRALIDLDWRERAAVLALLVPVVWIGVYPDPVLRRVEPSVVRTLRRIEARVVTVADAAERVDGGDARRAQGVER